MKTIGYARVSSLSQSLEVQLDQLKAAGCDKLFAEKRSGTSTQGREALAEALDYAREGDTLVVTRLDRLARSAANLHAIVSHLGAKGIGFRCLQQGSVDTTTSMGKLILGILGAVAEFETDIRRERQKEGIERAKEAGVYKGRPATIDPAKVREMHASGVGPS